MTTLEQTIHAIEHGLLKVTRGSERPANKMELMERMEHYKVPGLSAAFVYQQGLAWAKGFGVMDAGSKNSITTETIFQAASISKPVTGMVAPHLVEAGLLIWMRTPMIYCVPGKSQRASTPRRVLME